MANSVTVLKHLTSSRLISRVRRRCCAETLNLRLSGDIKTTHRGRLAVRLLLLVPSYTGGERVYRRKVQHLRLLKS